MSEPLPCPMCGSSVRVDSTGALECYGKTWQTMFVECQRELDEHCGMEMSLHADFWDLSDAEDILVKAWNELNRKKT